jgi:hypothetical protein
MARDESFADFVTRTRAQAIDQITINARQASHIAKIATGVNRQRLYARKVRLISRALELDPHAFVVEPPSAPSRLK